jgi:hypothetical protein
MRTKVGEYTQVDFWVRKDASSSSLVETVHDSVSCVCAQTRDEKCTLIFSQKARCFWPVCAPELGDTAHEDRDESFDDENPSR